MKVDNSGALFLLYFILLISSIWISDRSDNYFSNRINICKPFCFLILDCPRTLLIIRVLSFLSIPTDALDWQPDSQPKITTDHYLMKGARAWHHAAPLPPPYIYFAIIKILLLSRWAPLLLYPHPSDLTA